MRIATIIGFAGLLTVQLALSRGRTVDQVHDHECDQARRPADLCLNQVGDSSEPVSVDDDAMQKRIEQQGGAIVEQSRATTVQALIKQLGIERCELDLESNSSPPENESQMYERGKESVVVVSTIFKCDKCNDWHATTATGFVISSSGAIATNYHVIDNPDKETIVVMTADGQVVPVTRVLAASRADDLAIIQVNLDGLTPLPIARQAEPVGSHIGVISHPSQRFYCYTSGVVSRYMRMKPNDQIVDGMTITADYARGSSGGPVLNANGEVVGIVQSTDSIYYSVERGQQKNLQMVFKRCIPAASLLKLIDRGEIAAK